MSAEQALVALVIFFAALVQAGAGFGSALFAMPFLVLIIGVRAATPLMALISIVISVVLLAYYRTAFNVRATARMSVAALVGVPLGVYGLSVIDPAIVTTLLGIVLIGYAIYALAGFEPPRLERPAWGYLFGFTGGLLGGAYATSGPPVIVYAHCRRWGRAEFKSNLQGFFLISALMAIASHFVAGNYTADVWNALIFAIPATLLGLGAGVTLDRFINQQRFRQLVQILLIFLGIGLIV